MKIVTVLTTTSRGGAEFATVDMLDALIERGNEAVMITDFPALAERTRLRTEPISIGPKLSTRTWGRLMLLWLPYMGRLRKALEAEAPYDVLLVHYKKEQLMARWLPPKLRAGLVWSEWGPVPYPLRKGLPQRMYLAAAERARKIMAVSAGTKESVTDVGVPDDKVEVVPNVMSAEKVGFSAEGRARVRKKLGIPEDAFVVGCVSRFHPKKRNDVVIEAVKLLDDDRAHLLLAGNGETEAELRATAEPLGDRAHFIVPAPRPPEIGDIMSALDVSVFCPSPTEGAPRAVMLAMLCSRPCLSTGREGVWDMITPGIGAIASPENDPSSLADIIRPYFEDPERLKREGDEARRVAIERYDAPSVAARIEELFRTAAEG